MPHVDIEIENEIRGMVHDFVEGMRALARKAVLQSVAHHLEVDVRAAGASVEPASTPSQSRPKHGAALPAAGRSVEREEPARTPARGGNVSKSKGKAAARARRSSPERRSTEPR
jgi:hypothetical protein